MIYVAFILSCLSLASSFPHQNHSKVDIQQGSLVITPGTCTLNWDFPTASQVFGLPQATLQKTFGVSDVTVTMSGGIRWYAEGNGYVRHALPSGFDPVSSVTCQGVDSSKSPSVTETFTIVSCPSGSTDKYCVNLGSSYIMANNYKLRGYVQFVSCQWKTSDRTECVGCYGSAGLVSGTSKSSPITSSSLTASSYVGSLSNTKIYSSAGSSNPVSGNVNSIPWAWVPSDKSITATLPYIDIDLQSSRTVCQIITQGRDDKYQYAGTLGLSSKDPHSPKNSQYVTKLQVLYKSEESNDWTSAGVFNANSDRGALAFIKSFGTFTARYIRLKPTQCTSDSTGNTCALRFEIMYNI